MIYLELILGFLKVGCFAFGGAYGAIPLIRDVVMRYGWLTEQQLARMIAISESTPGPIMVNLATYVGSVQAGLPGSILATLAVVLPSFLIIFAITAALKTALKNPCVQAVLRGVKPCIAGVILATGLYMTCQYCAPAWRIDARAAAITAALAAALWAWPRVFRRKLSPIALILLGAAAGMAVYGGG